MSRPRCTAIDMLRSMFSTAITSSSARAAGEADLRRGEDAILPIRLLMRR